MRGALAARGTRREPVHGGSMTASMPPTVPQSARTPHQIVRWWFVEERTNPGRTVANCSVETLRTDHLDWSLSAHRRRTLGGMDAATELTGTYLQRVLRWWAGKGPAAHLQRRVCGALAARGTRREPVHGGSMAASMPPTVPQSARTPHQIVRWWCVEERANRAAHLPTALLRLCAPTVSTGPCQLTVAGPLAAWMPPRSLQGRTCSVSCDGGRARAPQHTCSVECAVPSPLAGHSVNPSMGARWRHPCRQRSRNRRGHRTR
ncbi:conserved hypothetical protein [Xanthomonas campestris pv. raphani 756C]|nr:conserved hypothetical protein [Xanthomonas campestris pv. raphani 756C]